MGHDLHAHDRDAIGRRGRAGDMAGGGVNSPSIVWINGRLEPAERAVLTVTDRGFQVGDGIFETLLVVGGRVLELPLHASRLRPLPRCSPYLCLTILSSVWDRP